MEHLLIHPPFADPTQPYLSLPTLKGALRSRGLDARVVDLNLEAAHWLFEPETMEGFARRIGSRFVDLNREPVLDFEEQLEYRRIVEARTRIERALGAVPSPIDVFQRRELFFDPSQYALARRRVEGYFEALSAAHWPFRFGFNHAAHAVLPWSFDLLEEYAQGRRSPLRSFYEGFFAGAREDGRGEAGERAREGRDAAGGRARSERDDAGRHALNERDEAGRRARRDRDAAGDRARSERDDAGRHAWAERDEIGELASGGTGPAVDLDDVGFIGVSIVFPSQIPEAFHLLRFLRERAPRAFLALGGPCIHQVVVHLEPELRRLVLAFVDGVGLFEGEETLAQLLPRLEAWRGAGSIHGRARPIAGRDGASGDGPSTIGDGPSTSRDGPSASRDAPRAGRGSTSTSAVPRARFELLRDVPNLLLAEPDGGDPVIGPRWTLDLREAEAPDYSDLDLDRYLAPSRTLLYAPTRGCYWGKCSFCYYGLAEAATASYREVPPERAASQLAQLSRRFGVKNVYISCDVLSPSYALRLAQALVDRKSRIRWSSDLKIEKAFTPERCALLHRAGLRSAAFGIESGSDRILDLMRKGCDRETMTAVNRAFHEAGIATEWMTFTDHPGEGVEEALATVRWIEEERDAIGLFIVGRFGLERGSHVMQEPSRYGVKRVWYAAGDELRLYALFEQRSGRRSRAQEERIEREIDGVAAGYDLHPYPWAGANSTHHTFLHFLELGPNAFKTHFKTAGAALRGALPVPPTSHIAGLRERPRFDVEAIARNEAAFFGEYLQRALYTTLPSSRAGGPGNEVAPLSASDYAAASARVEPLRAGYGV